MITKSPLSTPTPDVAQLQHLHRITEKLKPSGLVQASSPTPHSKQNKLEQVLQGLIHSNWISSRMEMQKSHHLSGPLCLSSIRLKKSFRVWKENFPSSSSCPPLLSCCHAPSPALSPLFPHTEGLQAAVGSPLAVFLLDFTCWTSPAFRAAPWAHCARAAPLQPHVYRTGTLKWGIVLQTQPQVHQTQDCKALHTLQLNKGCKYLTFFYQL